MCIFLFGKIKFIYNILNLCHLFVLKAYFWGLFRANLWELNLLRTKIFQGLKCPWKIYFYANTSSCSNID